eukprot:scaffold6909_cov56-Phaeocystis_antarctica.AAC.2
MQARLSAAFELGIPPSSAAGGAAVAFAASLSAFSAFSASRTSLVPAPRSGCCARSLASSGLGPRPGSATCSPRTASRRVSGVQGSHMRPRPATSPPARPARRQLASQLHPAAGTSLREGRTGQPW